MALEQELVSNQIVARTGSAFHGIEQMARKNATRGGRFGSTNKAYPGEEQAASFPSSSLRITRQYATVQTLLFDRIITRSWLSDSPPGRRQKNNVSSCIDERGVEPTGARISYHRTFSAQPRMMGAKLYSSWSGTEFNRSH